MPKIVAQADCCFKKAVGFLKKYQNMALPDAMKLADFSVQSRNKHVVPSAWSCIAYGKRQRAATKMTM